jgi:hypothetical protein
MPWHHAAMATSVCSVQPSWMLLHITVLMGAIAWLGTESRYLISLILLCIHIQSSTLSLIALKHRASTTNL